MANNFPCNTTPVKFISCCDVMDCIDIKSSDNSVTVEKSGCGVDITQTGNNLDQILELTDSGCITWVKEFIDGVLTYTPQLNIGCIEEEIDIDNLITVANGNCITFVKTVVDGVTIYTPTIDTECIMAELCDSPEFEACVQEHQILPTPETTFAGVDSSSIDWTPGGTAGHTPTAVVKISANVGNQASIVADGVFVPAPAASVDDAVNGLNLDGTDVKLGGDLIEHTEITDTDFNLKLRNNALLLGNLTDVNTFAQPAPYASGANRLVEASHKVTLLGSTAIPINIMSGFVYETGIDENTHQFLGLGVQGQFHFKDQMTFGPNTQDSVISSVLGLSGNSFTSITPTYPISAFQAGIYLNDPAFMGETDSNTPGNIVDVSLYSVLSPNKEPAQSLSDSPTITNLYGLFIDDFQIGSAIANVTNKFAIYQKGATDISRFFGPVQNASSVTQFTSDERVKENIVDYNKGLAEIDAINVKSFNYTYSKDREVVGVIAQELEQILPEAVTKGYFETPDKSQKFDDFRMVDQNRLIYTMLNAIKELSEKVKQLEAKQAA